MSIKSNKNFIIKQLIPTEIIISIILGFSFYYLSSIKSIFERVSPVILGGFRAVFGILINSIIVWFILHFTRKKLIILMAQNNVVKNIQNNVVEKIQYIMDRKKQSNVDRKTQNDAEAETNEDEIEKQILDYVEKCNMFNYAILIDGEWGIGKTYFVKKSVIPLLEKTNIPNTKNKYKTIYISLYGIKCTEDLSNQIYISTSEKNKKFNISKKLEGIIDAGKLIVSDLTKTSFLKKISIKTIIGQMSNLNKFVFIFDDLERCSMPINDTLGYINNLVEQNAIKTIIVANQKEISSVCYSDNIELKYLLCTNEKIDFTVKSIDSEKSQYNTQSVAASDNQSKIDLDEMNKRLAYLFSRDNSYETIKEKLIGQTILYKPAIPNVIENIINIYTKDNALRSVVLENKDKIADTLEEYNHVNIRTVQFAFDHFNKLGSIAVEAFNSSCFIQDTLQETLKALLFDVLITSIYFKNGRPKYEKWKDSNSGSISFEKSIWTSHYFSFKFTHEFIYDGILDTSEMSKVLLVFMENEDFSLRLKDDPLTLLDTYWKMEDKEVIQRINQLRHNFMSNNSIYKKEMFTRILNTLYSIKDVGIEVTFIDEIFEKMKKNLESSGTKIGVMHGRLGLNQNNRFYDDFTEKCNILTDIINSQNNRDTIEKLNYFFSYREGWANEFINYVRENKDEYLNRKQFFSFIDIKKCLECIKQSKVKDICDFKDFGYLIYNFSNIDEYYKSDIESITEFISLLNEYKVELESKPNNKIKVLNIGLLISNLKNILNRLKDKPKDKV